MTPTIVLLHALGGGAASWEPVIDRLEGFECLPIDLPGFGAAEGDPRVTIEEMVRVVEEAIRTAAPTAWVIVGHSMGGKIATIVASRSERGKGPSGLVGVMLVAGSPPEPEPMDEERRAAMIGWVADGGIGDADARTFVDDNIADPLPPPLYDAAVASVRASSPNAWYAWLTRGSREDWSREVGTLATPALIVAGGEDGDLGEAAQRRLNLPHYRNGVVHVVEGAAHLMPLEKSDEIAALIRDFAAAAVASDVPESFAALIASDRVSAKTRAILLDRARTPLEGQASALDAAQMTTLRLLVARIIPNDGIDLFARIAAGIDDGDGWRFAELPEDAAAYRAGLDALASLGFAEMAEVERDDLLDRIAAGAVATETLAAGQLALWFEDVRADAVRHWVSHPATMARIGYDGIANGGDGVRKQGFQRTAADTREAWEPRA